MKGQLQTLEPIIVVMMLGIVLGIGLLFYVRVNQQQNAQDTSYISEQENVAFLSRIARLPELACSRDVSSTNCIDLYKASAFAAMLQDDKQRIAYFPVFGATHITIAWVDATGAAGSIDLYNGRSEKYTASRTYFTVFDPVHRTRNFATMIIERQAK